MRTIILKAKKSEDNRKKMVRIKEYENMEKIEKSEKKLQQISIQQKNNEKERKNKIKALT